MSRRWVHAVWMREETDNSAELFAKSYMLRWSEYRSLANACSHRPREQAPTGSNNGYDGLGNDLSIRTNFVRY